MVDKFYFFFYNELVICMRWRKHSKNRNFKEIDNTSYETYLKGELSTYSEELLKMYAEFIIKLAREGKNLARITIENTAHLQGYTSLEEAEQKQ